MPTRKHSALEDTHEMVEYLGWAATAVFVGSYFFRDGALRRAQMLGASMWIVYGLLIRAVPVAVANLLVLLAAVWAQRRSPAR